MLKEHLPGIDHSVHFAAVGLAAVAEKSEGVGEFYFFHLQAPIHLKSEKTLQNPKPFFEIKF